MRCPFTRAVVGSVAAAALSLVLPADADAQNRSRRFGPGKCGPVDPAHLKTASETGGQPFFLSPSEIVASAQIMRETSGADNTLILWASDSGGEREFTLPVDGTMARMTLSAMFDTTGGVMTIVAPDGRTVSADGRIEDTPLNCGRIVTIPTPETGSWRVRAAPSGRFWLVVHARSELDIISTAFVQLGGRPGHEGLMKISGRPTATGPATLRVTASTAGARSVEFHLLSMEGLQLQRVDLPRVGREEFAGPIDLPTGSFRVAMSGVDGNGFPFQRVFNTAFRGELVELSSADAVETVQPGQLARLRIRLRNSGPRAKYRIVSTHVAQVLKVAPPEVEVDEGADSIISVWLPVPADAAPDSSVEVLVTATSDDARETTNYVMRRLTVREKQ